MSTFIERYAAQIGIAGALLWLVALTSFALGDIEYQDPTRQNPIPEWVGGAALVAGSVLIALFVLRGMDRRRGRGLRIVVLTGVALSLVPLWPFIFFGPFLAAVGFFALAVSDIRASEGTGAAWFHAIGLPLSLPSGMAFDALGMNGGNGGLVFGVVLAAGIGWRAYETTTARPPADRIEAPAAL